MILSTQDKEYIINNCRKRSDFRMGKVLGVSPNIITYYRINTLRVRKHNVRNNMQDRINDEIELEIKALTLFSHKWQSFSESANQRIELLKIRLDEQTTK